MATIIFQGTVNQNVTRVVDLGAGMVPRVVVEIAQPPDHMGGIGWSTLDPIPGATLGMLLLAAHVIT
jgi:hypothetical protein